MGFHFKDLDLRKTSRVAGWKSDPITISANPKLYSGLNGLKGGVRVTSFDIPGDEAVPPGGVKLQLHTEITNPSFASMYDVGEVSFKILYQVGVLGYVPLTSRANCPSGI